MTAGALAAETAARQATADPHAHTTASEPRPAAVPDRPAPSASMLTGPRASALNGPVNGPRPRSTPNPARPRPLAERYRRVAPSVISDTAAILGVASLLDSVWPHGWRAFGWLTPMLPSQARETAGAVIAVSGLLLLRVAAGLRRRKRAEWRLAVLICVALIVADVVRNTRHPVVVAVTLLLLACLLSVRRQYTAKSDPRSRWFAARVAVQFLIVAVGYGLICLWMPGRVAGHVSFGARVREVVLALVGMFGAVSIRGPHYAAVFHLTMFAFGLLTICCVLMLLIRAPEPAATLLPEDEARLRQLVGREGWRDSLGYFALRRDKSVVWSATGKAAVLYRVVAGVALVSGDPIGDPEAWPGAIAAYRRLIEENGWTPAVMGGSERGATVFKREYGLSALTLGDEAILDVSAFGLTGRAMRGVRQACGRLEREGYAVSVRRAGVIDADELARIRNAAQRWRGDEVERGFSMALSRLGDPGDGDCVIVTAQHGGRLCGLLHFVPWGADGLSLDLMRRDREAGNGLNELMITSLMRACVELRVSRVSLNFAVFRDPLERGERIGAGPLLRVRRFLLLQASRWWQIDSLYRFNAKFQPVWEPRFISYQSVRDLPRIALAALEAEAFIVRPRRLKRMLGRA